MDTKSQEILAKAIHDLIDLQGQMLESMTKLRTRIHVLELIMTTAIGIDVSEIYRQMEKKGIKIT